MRAYRTTLARFGESLPLDTGAHGRSKRRISAAFKDMPGGQVLGPTFDYTHRLLGEMGKAANETALASREAQAPPEPTAPVPTRASPSFSATRRSIEDAPCESAASPGDITREPLEFPADRDVRLQSLARGDEGFLLGARLFDAARLRPHASLRRRNPLRRGRGGI